MTISGAEKGCLAGVLLAGIIAIAPAHSALSAPEANPEANPGADRQPDREWDFTVWLDDREIGHHRFAVTDNGVTRRVDIEAAFRVRLLFVTVYRYHHDNREQWSGDCIDTISALTDDNGKEYRVDGQRLDDSFLVETGDGVRALPACVRSFAYWDPRILDGGHLLNTQTGEHLEVRVESLGADTIEARGDRREAERYRLSTDEIEIDLWYSPQQEWLALESTTTNGARLRYRLR